MQTGKKVVERVSSGDAEFDTAMNKFFPKKSKKTNLQLLEEKTGVLLNDGKTSIRINWDINIDQLLPSTPQS